MPITARLSDSVSPRSMATSTPGRLATAEPAFRKIWNRHYSIGQLCDKKADEVYISPQHGMLAFVVILFGSQWGRSDVAATLTKVAATSLRHKCDMKFLTGFVSF